MLLIFESSNSITSRLSDSSGFQDVKKTVEMLFRLISNIRPRAVPAHSKTIPARWMSRKKTKSNGISDDPPTTETTDTNNETSSKPLSWLPETKVQISRSHTEIAAAASSQKSEAQGLKRSNTMANRVTRSNATKSVKKVKQAAADIDEALDDTETDDDTLEELLTEHDKSFSNETGAARVIQWSRRKHPPEEPPPAWREIWRSICMMRSPGAIAGDAPVDSMGCHTLGDTTLDPKIFRFQSLVGLMLSSQTRDEYTSAAVERLKQLPGGLTVDSILAVPEDELYEILRNVSFYRNKTKYLKATAKILKEERNYEVPATVEELVKLPGVGPKMANLFVQIAYGTVEGIGVDVHVHRITNRFRWHKTRDPEGSRKALEEWLPKPLWTKINPMLVGFGQKVCKAVSPLCSDCYLAAADLCPAAPRSMRSEARRFYSEEEEAHKCIDADLPRIALDAISNYRYDGPSIDIAHKEQEELAWCRIMDECYEAERLQESRGEAAPKDKTLSIRNLYEMFARSERIYEAKNRVKGELSRQGSVGVPNESVANVDESKTPQTEDPTKD